MHRSVKRRTIIAGYATFLLLGSGQAALAQAATSSEETGDGGEIVVTAQKRSEKLRDVPISITAIGGDAIARQRITQADDLVSKAANLQVAQTVGENTPIFSLRGVSMSDFSLNQSGPVATYYDEVYKGNFAFLGIALFDLERVEVLRGPQGTLYGKNTTGGAVNLISRRPNQDLNSTFGVGYGNYDRVEANGALNLPLGDTLATRVAFTFARAHGWFENLTPGGPDLQSIREYGIRISTLWEPSDDVSFLLRASTSLQNPRNYGVLIQPGPLGVGAGTYEAFGQGPAYRRAGLGRRQLEANVTDRRRARTYALALTSDIAIGDGLTVTSVTSYDKGRLFFAEDSDGSPTAAIEIPYTDKASQLTEDLRLSSDWAGPFNFIIGAYFSREKVYNRTTFGLYTDIDADGSGTIDAQDCATAFPVACNITNRFDQLKHSYALYGDARYDLGGGVTLRGGLRYTHDDGRQTDLRSDAFGVDNVYVLTLIPSLDLAYKTDNLSGKIGIDYKPDQNILVYGSYSRGFRAPSFNAQAFFDPSEASVAKAETIDAFEIGAKTQLWDRRISLSTAAFYYAYKNQQFINVDPNTAAQSLVNVDKSRIYGGEIELSVRAHSMVTLNAGLGLLSSRIQKGMLSGVDLKGNKLASAPSMTFNGSLDITAIDDGLNRLSFHPNISFVSSQYFEVLNVRRIRQKSYALLGGNIDFERGPLTLSIWGKNITNRFYLTSRLDLVAGFGYDYNHVGSPRTYGASLTYDF